MSTGEGSIADVLSGAARWSLGIAPSQWALGGFPDACLDACVCDPPYELGFMGKRWDSSGIAYSVDLWREVLRVLKPGAHLLAFGGTRTSHRMVCAIEDAGFEVRDSLAWMYASGFPKSLNVSKAIDAHNGDERPKTGRMVTTWSGERAKNLCIASMNTSPQTYAETSAASAAWNGWGTALKPAMEPIVLARKPLSGTVAANVLEHGTGGINVDGCRIEGVGGGTHCANRDAAGRCLGHRNAGQSTSGETFHGADTDPAGRWPANVIHDGSPEVLEAFARYGERASGVAVMRNGGGRRIWGADNTSGPQPDEGYLDSGSAARFFFCAKASRAERELGCEHLPAQTGAEAVDRTEGSAGVQNPRAGAGRTASAIRNVHPTVKPLALMRYLCRLVTPPGGVVLDPFAGSGTTGMAAMLEGFRFVGIDIDAYHGRIARARINHVIGYGAPPEDERKGYEPQQTALFDVA